MISFNKYSLNREFDNEPKPLKNFAMLLLLKLGVGASGKSMQWVSSIFLKEII